MKIRFIILGVFFSWASSAQDYLPLKKRVEDNLKLVSNDFRLRARVQIDNTGIVLYDSVGSSNVVTSLDWKEVPKFLEIVENWDYYTMVDAFERRGQVAFAQADLSKIEMRYRELPSSWNGLVVVLDPGHFGGNMDEAKLEDRYASFRAQDIGEKKDVTFYEADLTYPVCELAKKYIEAKGGKAIITRQYGKSALGKSFAAWKKEDFRSDLEAAYKKKDLAKELYEALRDSATDKFIFENFYKFLEFRKRVSVINKERPDITIAVHFNAKEGNKRFGGRYLAPVTEDYNMVFIPGGFLDEEIVKTDQKIDFLRLLVSRDIENSMKLGKYILKSSDSLLKVPAIPAVNNIHALRDMSVLTEAKGVYARNLVLTRMARGTVVYLEALYQDNIDELKRLSKKDFSYTINNSKRETSYRCNEIAISIVDGINGFLVNNARKGR